MKTLKLNAPILDIEDKPLQEVTGYQMNPQMEQIPIFENITYRQILLPIIVHAKTKTSQQMKVAFNLAKKIKAITTEEAIEVSDEEYIIIEQCIAGESVIVQARFTEMVEELNPTTPTQEEDNAQ